MSQKKRKADGSKMCSNNGPRKKEHGLQQGRVVKDIIPKSRAGKNVLIQPARPA